MQLQFNFTGTSPSGAHTEPWTFVVVASPECKTKIWEIIEKEEQINYMRRMNQTFLKDIEKFSTTWRKPYLEIAPYIIVVFMQNYSLTTDGQRKSHYYSQVSTSIAIGILLAALTVRLFLEICVYQHRSIGHRKTPQLFNSSLAASCPRPTGLSFVSELYSRFISNDPGTLLV